MEAHISETAYKNGLYTRTEQNTPFSFLSCSIFLSFSWSLLQLENWVTLWRKQHQYPRTIPVTKSYFFPKMKIIFTQRCLWVGNRGLKLNNRLLFYSFFCVCFISFILWNPIAALALTYTAEVACFVLIHGFTNQHLFRRDHMASYAG